MTDNVKFWDKNAAMYSKKAIANPEAYQRKLVVTKGRMQRGHRLLDIGCGTGSLAFELAPHCAHIHAIDLSGAMIAIANEKATRCRATNVTFHQAQLDDSLPFEPESFDGICAYSLLHLVDDRDDALRQIFTLLKPGGFFVSSTACLGESLVPYKFILPMMRWLGKAPHVDIFNTEKLMSDMRRTGFERLISPEVGAPSTTSFIVADKPFAQTNAA